MSQRRLVKKYDTPMIHRLQTEKISDVLQTEKVFCFHKYNKIVSRLQLETDADHLSQYDNMTNYELSKPELHHWGIGISTWIQDLV